MHHVFFDLLDRGVVIYLDDILVYNKDVASHQLLLQEIFDRLAKFKLYVKGEKCALFLGFVEFLGHRIDTEGVPVK
jgi:hypothetical protein